MYEHFKSHLLPRLQYIDRSTEDRFTFLLLAFALKEHTAGRFNNANDCFSRVEKNLPSALTSQHRIIWSNGCISLKNFEKAEKIVEELNLDDKSVSKKDYYLLFRQLGDYHSEKFGWINFIVNTVSIDPYYELRMAIKFYSIATEKVSEEDFVEFTQKLLPIFKNQRYSSDLTRIYLRRGPIILKNASFKNIKAILPKYFEVLKTIPITSAPYEVCEAIWQKAMTLSTNESKELLDSFFKATDSLFPKDHNWFVSRLMQLAESCEDPEKKALLYLFAMRPEGGENNPDKGAVMLMQPEKKEAMQAFIRTVEKLSSDSSKRNISLMMLNEAIAFRGNVKSFFSQSKNKQTLTCKFNGFVDKEDNYLFDVGAKLHFLKAQLLEQIGVTPREISEEYLMAYSLGKNPLGAGALFLEGNDPLTRREDIEIYKNLALKAKYALS